jgi:hypothetical protein
MEDCPAKVENNITNKNFIVEDLTVCVEAMFFLENIASNALKGGLLFVDAATAQRVRVNSLVNITGQASTKVVDVESIHAFNKPLSVRGAMIDNGGRPQSEGDGEKESGKKAFHIESLIGCQNFRYWCYDENQSHSYSITLGKGSM